MEAYLALAPEARRQLCEEISAKIGLAPASLEKDFWICWTLRELFALPKWGDHLTFKGGTSLSKGWGLISRFSEDIDVVIDRDFLGFPGDDPSSGDLKRLRAECSKQIKTILLPEFREHISRGLKTAEGWSLEMATPEEDRDEQTVLFKYPSEFGGQERYVRSAVKIEFGARSDVDPNLHPGIQTLIADAGGLTSGAPKFKIRTVAPKRTFWEKAMLLHEENHRPERRPKPRLSRHYYDLWCLINAGVADEAMKDAGLFKRIADHRQHFFRHTWMDYSTLSPGSLKLLPSKDHEEEWRRDYHSMQDMIYNDRPEFDEILKHVHKFQNTFNKA